MRNNQIPQINPAQLLAQYQNPGEALKGIGKSLGAQADSMETQRLREIELARQNRAEQRIIDDRVLVADEKLKVDTQNKLNADTIRATERNIGKLDLDEELSKIPLVDGAVSLEDADKLRVNYDAGMYTVPVNTAELDVYGLKAVRDIKEFEKQKVLAAKELEYKHGQDALNNDRTAKLDARETEKYNAKLKQDKLSADAIRARRSNIYAKDISDDYNKMLTKSGGISVEDADRLLTNYNAGMYFQPVETAELDVEGLSTIYNIDESEAKKKLDAKELKYKHEQDAKDYALRAQVAKQNNIVFNQHQKEYKEQQAYNARLFKNAGIQVYANPELQQELMNNGGVPAPPKDVIDAYSRVTVNKATGKVEGTPADLAVIRAFEVATTELVNNAFAKRDANIGEISEATAKHFKGTNAYANLEAIKQKMGTETATALNKVALDKERTELLKTLPKSGATEDGTSSHTGNIGTNPAESIYKIMHYTDKNPAPPAVQKLVLRLLGEGYEASQIKVVAAASISTTDSTFGFGGGTFVDEDKVKAAKASVGPPKKTTKGANAVMDRLAEIDRQLGGGKVSLKEYTSNVEALRGSPDTTTKLAPHPSRAAKDKVIANVETKNALVPDVYFLRNLERQKRDALMRGDSATADALQKEIAQKTSVYTPQQQRANKDTAAAKVQLVQKYNKATTQQDKDEIMRRIRELQN